MMKMILDLYEQCKYKMYIINNKKKNVGARGGGQMHAINAMQTIIVILTIKK